MPTTWQAIYLGFSDTSIDPTEGSAVSENADQLVGLTIGSPAEPLFDRIVTITTLDNRGVSGSLDTDRGGGSGNRDQISYDLGEGAGTQTEVYEGLGVYDATITFFDGSTATVSAVIFQDEAGNGFLAPEVSGNADSAAFQSGPIVSISIGNLITNNANLTANRNGEDFITCFAAGTLIETSNGLRPVEDLHSGDRVMTVDEGLQTLRWTGARKIDTSDAEALRPVLIRAGALSDGVPSVDLMVSQQHRILVRSAIAQRMFGTDEVLVAARQLTSLPGIEIVEDAQHVTYVHLLFDRHQLVISNGAVTESLFTGPQALKGVSEAARTEILGLFPELAEIGEDAEIASPVRPLVRGRLGRKLAERHLANDKPVVAAN